MLFGNVFQSEHWAARNSAVPHATSYKQRPNFHFSVFTSHHDRLTSLDIMLMRQWLLWRPTYRGIDHTEQMDPISLLAKQYREQSFVKINFKKQIRIGCRGNKAKRADSETKREREKDETISWYIVYRYIHRGYRIQHFSHRDVTQQWSPDSYISPMWAALFDDSTHCPADKT